MVSSAHKYLAIMPGDTQQVKTVSLYQSWIERRDKHALNLSSVVIPAVGIGYGFLALHSGSSRKLDFSTRNEILEDHPFFHTHIDNYLQFSPAATVIGLNIAGIHGLHSFKDELVIYGISTVIMLGAVESLKPITHEQRPDGSSYRSFPSGHTATAFAAAEWLRTEYWHRSPWIGIAGYAMATSVGVLRVYNNRHWVSDVVAGAAIGFLSTRIAYAINPWVEKHILHQGRNRDAISLNTRLEWHYPSYISDVSQ
jgi:membrane-associated phospholipid phosphatase